MDLDDRQREAVDHASGPLRVEAGPGSGKTRVIVERAARLVAGGLPQDSILCVTFTRKAAGEMDRRLQEMDIGGVRVETIHSFCLEVLRENYLRTGISEKTRRFSELARLVWCVRNSDRFGIDGEVIRLDRNPADLFGPMMSAVSLAKRELISPEDLERRISQGPPGPDDQEWFDQLAELSKVYRAYDSYKTEKNLIDYDDMVAATVRLMSQDRSVLERYRQRYRHVLVDEFQDNNYAQFLLVRLLAGSGGITVVGDVDQSIMGFQGAFSGIFNEFADAYPDARFVRLDRNYRCSASVSEISTRLLAAEPDRVAAPAVPVGAAGEPAVVVSAGDEEAERLFVAEEIRRLGGPWKDTAVLCRTNRSCELFAETLRSHGIPAALSGTGNLMRNAAAVEVVSMLKVADSPQTAGREISWLLKRRGISEHNIAGINRVARGMRNPDSPEDCVFKAMRVYSGSDQDAEIREVARHLARMAEESRTAYLTDMLHRIMMEYTDLYRRNANSGGPEAARNLAILNAIHRMAEDYQHHYYGERLSDFVDYLEMAGDLEYSGLDASAEDGADAGDAVSVLTMHKSKGKEFGTVFVTGLYQDGIPGKWKKREFDIPADLLKGSGRQQDSAESHLREARNLLYVAITRAKDRLYLSHPRRVGESAKDREPSIFLGQIIGGDDGGAPAGTVRMVEYDGSGGAGRPAARDPLDTAKYRIQEEACGAIRESRVEAAAARLAELARVVHVREHGNAEGFDPMPVLAAGAAGLDKLVPPERTPLVSPETLSLSATAIRSYLECPLQFKYRSVLAVPAEPSLGMTKGSIIHDVLDTLGKERLGGGEPDIDAGVRRARDLWDVARRTHGGSPRYEKAAADLDGIIRRYAEWEAASPNSLVETEARFATHIDDIRYTGKMDRVERNDRGGYEIVDFKTGSTVLPRREVALDPQLNIYAAAARAKYGTLPEKVSLVYLEKKNAVREYMVTPGSLEEGLKPVRAAAGNILDEKFEATPGYHCRWCPYRSICPAMVDG